MDALILSLVNAVKEVGWQVVVIAYFLWRDYQRDKQKIKDDAKREADRKETDAYIKSMLVNFANICTKYNKVADQTVSALNNHIKLLDKIYLFLQRHMYCAKTTAPFPREFEPTPADTVPTEQIRSKQTPTFDEISIDEETHKVTA